MDGLFTLIAAIISAVGTLASVWIGRRIVERRKRDAIIDETIQNANVYTAIEYLLNHTEADRAYIMEFHNGEHYFSGRGQQKFSCTYEVVREGISAEFSHSQNHRISNFHKYISELVNKGSFAYDKSDDVEDGAFRTLLRGKGVQSIFNVPLKTLNGKVIGILGIDYVKNIRSFDPEMREFMRSQARIVAGYLL